MPRKLRILACPANQGGCAYYRVIAPMTKLQELFSDKVEVRLNYNPLNWEARNKGCPEGKDEKEHIKWADVVMTNNLHNNGPNYTARIVGLAREEKKFVHYDTDDLLTQLYEEHKLADVYNKGGLSDITKFIYSNVDLITVTQRKFAERVKPYCKKFLAVIKNAIDYNLPCWKLPKQASKRIRIGWAGGIHHDPDVKVFAGVPHLLNCKVGREHLQWDFYGHPPPDVKEQWQIDTWKHYKACMLSGFKGFRNWNIHYALPPDQYGIFFANMDLSIAPLQMNDFNDSKSDIKVAETACYRIPLIASNVGCYEDTIINGETGFLIDPDAPKSEWVRVLALLVRNRELRERIGNNLYEVGKEFFDLNKVVGQRLEIYEHCFENGDQKPGEVK